MEDRLKHVEDFASSLVFLELKNGVFKNGGSSKYSARKDYRVS